MRIVQTDLAGVVIVEPDVFGDHRGFLMELYNRKNYGTHGVISEFVQDNLSCSCGDTLRGLHYQLKRPQAKLVQVMKGKVYDVAVDIRVGSPQFGKWVGVVLSETNKRQLFVPEGFAHGFCIMSDSAMVLYKCSDFYEQLDEHGVLWADPVLNIPWPVKNPILSDKDKAYKSLKDISDDNLPIYKR